MRRQRDEMSEFVAALIGTLVGATMVFVAEFWKQVLAGKAAATLIYAESHQNALMCDWAAKGEFYRPLTDTAWRTYSIHIVPLLTDEASKHTMITYLGIPVTQQRIKELQNDLHDSKAKGTTANELENHSRDFRIAAYWMHRVEKKGRFKILVELFTGRPTLPSAEEIAQALAATGSETSRGRP